MAEKDLVLKMILQAKDSMSGVIKKATHASDADFKALQERLAGTADKFDMVGKSAAKIGGVLTGISAVNIKLASDFQDSMANVDTLIDSNVENIGEMGKEVLNIARRTPVALNDITEGLYSIRSAGIEASNQFKVLEKSAMLGVAGRGSTAEAVDLVTSSLNAFKLEGIAADKVYDNIFKTVKYGKTTISGIAQGFGATAGVVASANIQLDEYLAAVAAMTTTGNPASQAHTQIKAAVAGLTRGTKEQQEIFNQLGAKTWVDLINKSGSMVNAFSRINTVIGGNQAKMIQLVGSIEAYNAIQSLTGANNEKYIQALEDMHTGQDALVEGYEKKLNTINSKMGVLRNSMQGLGIELGNSLLPAMNGIINVAGGLTNAFGALPDWLKSTISIGVAGFGALALAVSGISFVSAGAIRGFSGILNVMRDADILIWGLSAKLSEIPRINFNLRDSLSTVVTNIKAIPNTMFNAIAGMKGFIASCKTSIVLGFKNALTGIKSGFTNFIPNLKMAIAGMRSFNIVCALNPIGLIATAIAGGAFLIYKYWKPITSFFGGMVQGIQAGLAPLMPMFNNIGNAIAPLISGIKRFFAPINTEGKKAAEWGYKFGQGIAWCVNKVIDLCKWFKQAITLGGRIKFPSQNVANVKVDGSHASGLARVPYDGYVAELHKEESVLTKDEASSWRDYKAGSQGSITINYAPIVEIKGTSEGQKADFLSMLQQHKREIAEMVESIQLRKRAGAYAI